MPPAIIRITPIVLTLKPWELLTVTAKARIAPTASSTIAPPIRMAALLSPCLGCRDDSRGEIAPNGRLTRRSAAGVRQGERAVRIQRQPGVERDLPRVTVR